MKQPISSNFQRLVVSFNMNKVSTIIVKSFESNLNASYSKWMFNRLCLSRLIKIDIINMKWELRT